VTLHGASRRIVDKSFDDAIAGAVKAFATSQAQEVQRRRAEYLAFVAHDLRTPLSAITFSAHLLEQRAPSAQRDAETTRLLKTLTRNAKQLDGLVASVLNENTHLLTELGVKLERRTFDLWPLVESLVQDLQPVAIRTAARLVNQVPDDLQVYADANLLRRVFQNLISNAIAYTPRGTVQVGAHAEADGSVSCWVSDTGTGIDADRIDKVFDALEKDPGGDGMGLGLAIVKTFVEAHQGKVEVQSSPGEGTTFRFTLPSLKAPVEEVSASRPRAVPAPR
jgi:signal transduction histidine kinase